MQKDLHIPTLTVIETLRYCCQLRMPKGTSSIDIENRVEYLLSATGLEKVKDSLVGDQEIRGISGGQAKRLTIAVEIVSLPDLIFLGSLDPILLNSFVFIYSIDIFR